MTSNNICREHSGCLARLDQAEHENEQQWQKMVRMENEIKETQQEVKKVQKDVDTKHNQILLRVNILLCSLAVASIMFGIQAFAK